MAGLYIHIPFCKQACSYCDFYFVTRKQLIPDFVEALIREIYSKKNSQFSTETIKTIYLGGGTPSLLSAGHLQEIFDALHSAFPVSADEITIELNPDNVTPQYLKSLKEIGITRASMGVQSFQPQLLQFMHRAHTKGEALRALETLRDTGFTDFTADLIYGNPGQTPGMLRADIEQLLRFNPPHISAYSLTVEPNTRLGRQVQLGRITEPEDEQVSHHFDLMRTTLADAGLVQYEVSNFSLPGREAVHNSNYWNHHNYLGLGPAAHSFWWDDDGCVRWKNMADIRKYLNQPDKVITEKENLDLNTLAEERLMLGLRTRQGVDQHELRKRYGYTFTDHQLGWINHQQNKNTMIFDEGRLRMTPEGLKICDLLLVDLLSV